MMQKLIWNLRRQGRRLRWPWLLAVLVLAGSAIVYFSRVEPLAASLSEARADVVRLRAQAGETPVAAPQSAAEQLEAFYSFFPGEDVLLAVLGLLFESAARENLMLPQGEYKLTRETVGRLTRYDLSLPLKGPYPGLRRFIAQTLKETPALSLQGVSFSRQAVSEIGVDAQVRFTLYVRTEGV